MSLPPWQDPGNPGNPNSVAFQQIHGTDNVAKRTPNPLGDWLITAFIVGIFAVGTIMTLLSQ